MMDARSFPRVVVHHGMVDADWSIIAINTRDHCISRGNTIVSYGRGNRTGISKAFTVARLLLENAPRLITSRLILTDVYGPYEDAWPHDIANATGRPIYDLRHRACPRLGLLLDRVGQSQFRLLQAEARSAAVHAPQSRRVAKGRARPNRPGMRSFGLELADDDAGPVQAFALRHNVSFQEACRTLMVWGLESEAEAEKAS